MSTFTLDAIGQRLPEGNARLLRRNGEVVGRIVDLTPYVRVRANGKAHRGTLCVAPGGAFITDPRLALFEAQALDGQGFEEGPRFRRLQEAYEWLAGETPIVGESISVVRSLIATQKPPSGTKWLTPTPFRKKRSRVAR